MSDPVGAFCPGKRVRLHGMEQGPLAGLRFAAKDLYDVEGHITGCGNPDWHRTHAPATETAPAVKRLLEAGADLGGKTITDELAFSLNGQNLHYGTPVNSNARGRIPGGSSSGSAAAVAGGLVDFALGTDTGGSVRVPAGLCGIFGLRTTHGAVTLDGVMPLAPGFDVVGWFARHAELLARVGEVLLPPDVSASAPFSLAIAEDALDLADAPVAAALREAIHRIEQDSPCRSVKLSSVASPPAGALDAWMDAFRTLQGREIWATHGDWIEQVQPGFAPDIAERFAWSKTISEADAAAAAPIRDAVRDGLDGFLTDGTVLCLPTTPCVAPRLDADGPGVASFRTRALTLTCISGLGGVPQVTLPVERVPPDEGGAACPVGLSLISRRGTDRALLELTRRIAPLLELA